MKDIILMYDVDNFLYDVDNDVSYISVECPACCGKGSITLDFNYTCPKCDGFKTIDILKNHYYVKKRKITSANVFISEPDKYNVSYCLDKKYSVDEERINAADGYVFRSKSKAEKRAKELNEEENDEK